MVTQYLCVFDSCVESVGSRDYRETKIVGHVHEPSRQWTCRDVHARYEFGIPQGLLRPLLCVLSLHKYLTLPVRNRKMDMHSRKKLRDIKNSIVPHISFIILCSQS